MKLTLWPRRGKRAESRESLLDILARTVRLDLLRHEISSCHDWRELPERLAQSLRVSPREFFQLLARQGGVSIAHELEPFDLRRLGVEPEKLMNAGMAPRFVDGNLHGWVAVDPARARRHLPEICPPPHTLPMVLGRWSVIRDCVSESVKRSHLLGLVDRLELSQIEALTVRRVLELLAAEVHSFGRSAVMVWFGGESVIYEFETDSGANRARGRIGKRIEAPLRRILEGAAAEDGELLIGGVNSPIVTVDRLSETPGAFLLRWNGQSEECLLAPTFSVSENPPVPGRAPHLLVIEDSAIFSDVLRHFFSKQGLRVSASSDARSALADVERGALQPDLILCDLHLPGFNGLDFVRNARSLPALREIPIVILSSDDAADSQVTAFECGADGYLTKSSDPRILNALLNRLLNKKGLPQDAWIEARH